LKALALTSPDQPASVVDLPDPTAGPNGVRIRVHAASVNGFDVFEANGYLLAMMPHDLPTVVGRDFAGTVDQVGADRTDVAVGDEVFGFITTMPPLQVGTFAELVAEDARLVIVRKPAGLASATAAAIPLAGSTAVAAVDASGAGPDRTILVIGATGGVGSIAVQLAAQRGATVIGTAREGDQADWITEIGAAETIDYTTEDLLEAVRASYPDGVDGLIDAVSRDEAFTAVAALVRDGGHIATTLGAGDADALAARGITLTKVQGTPTVERLAALAEQVVAGTLRIRIQTTFPLDEAPAALAAFAAGTSGKIVLTVG